MRCHYFDDHRCRSCTLMGQPYAQQLADKDAHVRGVLADRVPAEAWLAPAESPEAGFRNKAKLVVGGRAGAVTLGILGRDGSGVDLRDCGLHEPELAAQIPVLADFVNDLGLIPYQVSGRRPTEQRGELKYLIVTRSPDDHYLIRFVLRSRRHLAAIRAALPRLQSLIPGALVVTVNLHPEHKAVLEGDEEIVLTPATTLPMTVAGVPLQLGPRAFFQTNTTIAAALYAQARTFVDQVAPASLWDLYCGVGGFALACSAPGRSVVGVETSVNAIQAATQSAAELGITDATFIVGDATAYAQKATGTTELVIVNPPRRGIGSELSGWLNERGPEHVIYSSCNAQSLAADLAAMPAYRPMAARLFDMFPQTSHHEVMVHLERR